MWISPTSNIPVTDGGDQSTQPWWLGSPLISSLKLLQLDLQPHLFLMSPKLFVLWCIPSGPLTSYCWPFFTHISCLFNLLSLWWWLTSHFTLTSMAVLMICQPSYYLRLPPPDSQSCWSLISQNHSVACGLFCTDYLPIYGQLPLTTFADLFK